LYKDFYKTELLKEKNQEHLKYDSVFTCCMHKITYLDDIN